MKIKNIAKRILNSHKDSTLNCGFMINPYIFGGGVVGGWKELARTTLGSASNTITVSSLPNKRYYMYLMNLSSDGNDGTRFGNGSVDTGFNYASRESRNGGADSTRTSSDGFYNNLAGGYLKSFHVGYVANYSTKEKLAFVHGVGQNTAGAGNAPIRHESFGKWTNTSNSLNIIQGLDLGGGNNNSGDEVVVLGWDPADTHTTNFWTELASADLSGGASATLSSGTFTAKKYLWVQAYLKHTGSNPSPLWRFNSDSGNNYASRQSLNGGAEDVEASISHLDIFGTTASSSGFINMFIINVSSKEKLVIAHHNLQNTAGAGNAPARGEHAVKWANTSSQITSISATTSINTFGTASAIKVWGSD